MAKVNVGTINTSPMAVPQISADESAAVSNLRKNMAVESARIVKYYDQIAQSAVKAVQATNAASEKVIAAKNQHFQKNSDYSKKELDIALNDYNKRRKEADRLTGRLRECRAEAVNLDSALSKIDNRAEKSSFLKDVVESPVAGLSADAVTSFVGAVGGKEAGSLLGGLWSGLVNGTSSGFPGIGSLIGIMKSLIDLGEQQHAADMTSYRSATQEQYKSLQEKENQALSVGSQIAMQGNEGYLEKYNTLQQLEQEIYGVMGEGYNKAMEADIDAQIAHLQKYGSALKELYGAAGTWKGEQTYARNQAIRNQEEKRLTEYLEGKVSGLEGYQNLKVASVEGEAAYRMKPSYKAEVEEMDRILIDGIKVALKDSWPRFGSILDQMFQENLDLMALQYGMEEEMARRAKMLGGYYTPGLGHIGFSTAAGKAFGLPYVPYNNFPVLLHQGERVLTAAEARSYGGGVQVTVTGNSFVVREEADIDRIAKAIAENLTRTQAVS